MSESGDPVETGRALKRAASEVAEPKETRRPRLDPASDDASRKRSRQRQVSPGGGGRTPKPPRTQRGKPRTAGSSAAPANSTTGGAGKAKKRERFRYGNYTRYYGYRTATDTQSDPRLAFMEPQWFAGKDCLDIGCNAGNFTISIADRFAPETITGVDIDPRLIRQALRNLQVHRSRLASPHAGKPFPVSFPICLGNVEPEINGAEEVKQTTAPSTAPSTTLPTGSAASATPDVAATEASAHPGLAADGKQAVMGKDADGGAPAAGHGNVPEVEGSLLFPKRATVPRPLVQGSRLISFETKNFVEGDAPSPELYDVVLCLSVTKWIHLNWGDEGVRTLFTRVKRSLRPGGLFILEPQVWSSYRKKLQSIPQERRHHYQEIVLRPEQFIRHVVEMGFTLVKETPPAMVSDKGFARPILAFRKTR